jgi:nickel-dependent lactate racemase
MNMVALESETGITKDELKSSLYKSLEGRRLKKVLLIPPDYTRMYSGAGLITAMYYDMLKSFCRVDIMPAVGTHDSMSKTEWRAFFGDGVPFSSMINHNWRKDVVKIGEVPSGFIEDISEGLIKKAIDVEINKNLLDTSYDLIISIGQVVPHEIAGMANYSKNIFVGCGGHSMISQTHILGAVYGMERIMGREHSPVRKVFDFAEQYMIGMLPLLYVLTVTTRKDDAAVIHGLYIGRDRMLFAAASALSQKMNITYLDDPAKKFWFGLTQKNSGVPGWAINRSTGQEWR